MKPHASRSPYYRRAERCAFELGGWQYTANRLGLTGEALQRVLGRTHGDNAKIAAAWCRQVEALYWQTKDEDDG